MASRITWERLDSTDVHWALIAATKDRDATLDEPYSDDGWVGAQALFCPYYSTLEGTLGSDWGVIVNPDSVKFGQVVFEHHWCGCPMTGEGSDARTVHGDGPQTLDAWVKPKRRRAARNGGSDQ